MDESSRSIGNTKYDMYNWSFTEGKRKEGNGWSIAIPDGFSIHAGSVVPEYEKRALFEATPREFEKENSVPLTITFFPQQDNDNTSGTGNWPFHPYAKAATAENLFYKNLVNGCGDQFIGCDSLEILSVGLSDVCAGILAAHVIKDNYRFSIYMCIFYTECKLQELFIHTKYYSDEQKKAKVDCIMKLDT